MVFIPLLFHLAAFYVTAVARHTHTPAVLFVVKFWVCLLNCVCMGGWGGVLQIRLCATRFPPYVAAEL